jgi:hypothetical protein
MHKFKIESSTEAVYIAQQNMAQSTPKPHRIGYFSMKCSLWMKKTEPPIPNVWYNTPSGVSVQVTLVSHGVGSSWDDEVCVGPVTLYKGSVKP